MSESLIADGEGIAEDEILDIPMPSEEQMELAEKIISRLDPKDRSSIGEMIHSRARWCGGIIAAWAVFWWLTVLRPSEDYDIAHSIFFGPDFMTVTILVPCLIFVGSILSDFSRELGQLFPGLVSGIMFVLSILYVFEPAVMGFVDNDLTPAEGMWRFARLALLSATVYAAAKLLIDAFLLGWVKRLIENHPSIQFTDTIPLEVEPEIEPLIESEP
jgi:hypothetical protein